MPRAEILIVPAMMLADYYLTLWGAGLFGATPERRAGYELNPHMIGDVARLKLVNPRHLAATATATVVFWTGAALVDAEWTRFLVGLMLGAYGVIIGNHLANILDMLSERACKGVRGRMKVTYRARLAMGAHRSLGSALPLVLIAAFAPGWLTLGAAAGALVIAVAQIMWRATAPKEALDRLLTLGRDACAFCGAGADTAKKLIDGDGGMICDECVGTCAEALIDESSAVSVASTMAREPA
jgi:hypothetical protein